jgi:hypothetical protein
MKEKGNWGRFAPTPILDMTKKGENHTTNEKALQNLSSDYRFARKIKCRFSLAQSKS